MDLSKEFYPVPKPPKTEKKKVKKIKQKSSKLAKLERNRYSIITYNLDICYVCKKHKKDHLDEVFGGRNRQTSMKYGLVIPICFKCHRKLTDNPLLKKDIQEEAKQIFIKKYSEEKFIKEFGR
jgi:hypothetical protein|uniref:HNHc nuclease n=1 Tax=Myoviridae sp. ct8mY9 TaxID=2827664 RepID=A0A8S5SEK9_9CAUD|nr:MAG TPA: Putative HNHc nuclease [Myoviridae sp. ct8mY9]